MATAPDSTATIASRVATSIFVHRVGLDWKIARHEHVALRRRIE
jgi:hypothetical protein